MNNQEVDTIIKALANPARRDILSWLKNPALEFPEQTSPYTDGVCVGQIYLRAVYRNQLFLRIWRRYSVPDYSLPSDWGSGCITSVMKL
jgi:transcriptional regulator, ArsR family